MFVAALIGFLFGFVGSMPVAGPIALLVFGRGLENRARSGLYLACGAAIAESIYAYLAFWGFSAFLVKYEWVVPVSRAGAAVILIALGLHFARRKNTPEKQLTPPDPNVGNKRSFMLGFTITALNPTLIATWTAAVTMVYSLDVVRFDAGGALPFSLGALVGITAWFVTLLYLLGRFKSRFSHKSINRVLRGMGILLLVLGAGFVARFIDYFIGR
jgi:threonine/homoserine/homoserine lactone efflux protein